MLSKNIFKVVLLVLLVTISCGPQESCHISEEFDDLFTDQPQWYRCLVQDIAHLYNNSFESPAPGSITSTDPRELFVIDSNGLDFRMDYRKQRLVFSKYPDSLLQKVWELHASSSMMEPDSMKAVLDINPYGMFVEHLAQFSASDTIIRDLHEYIVVFGSGQVPLKRALDSNVFDFEKLTHRYLVMMLSIVLNDNLKRKPWDFEGPRPYEPSALHDSSKMKWMEVPPEVYDNE